MLKKHNEKLKYKKCFKVSQNFNKINHQKHVQKLLIIKKT